MFNDTSPLLHPYRLARCSLMHRFQGVFTKAAVRLYPELPSDTVVWNHCLHWPDRMRQSACAWHRHCLEVIGNLETMMTHAHQSGSGLGCHMLLDALPNHFLRCPLQLLA